MRVLHVLSQRPEATGSGIYVRAMIREAARRGHDNALLAGVMPYDDFDFEGIEKPNASFVRFERELPFKIPGMSDVMPYPSCRFSDLEAAQIRAYTNVFGAHLSSMIESFQPDVIHTHHLWLLSSMIKDIAPAIPALATCHGTGLRQLELSPKLAMRVKLGVARLDKILALSQVQRKEIIAKHTVVPAQVQVTGAGFDDRRFYVAEKAVTPPVRIVYAGKLVRAKGVLQLLNALIQIEKLPWTLDLVGGGEGPEHDEVLASLAQLGSKVTVHGALPQKKLAKVLSSAHLLVLPSFFEGLPLVLFEALAAGCRIVTTALPGVVEQFAQMSSDAITLVALPKMQTMDRPAREGLADFEQALATAISTQVKSVLAHAQSTPEQISALVADHTWTKVFERVEAAYLAAVAERKGN